MNHHPAERMKHASTFSLTHLLCPRTSLQAPKPKTAVLHSVTTQAAFDELCAGKAAGVCVISALNPEDESYAAQLQR